MFFLKSSINVIDKFTLLIGHSIAWLTLAMMLITCLVVILRYGFSVGSIALQESITYLHATVFILGCGYTLQQGGHVRVDIFYCRFSRRAQALIDLVGAVFFLLPLCLFIAWSSWDYVLRAWHIKEASPEAGGLPLVYMLKTLIPLLAASLLIQGVAEILRNLLVLLDSDLDQSTPSTNTNHLGVDDK